MSEWGLRSELDGDAETRASTATRFGRRGTARSLPEASDPPAALLRFGFYGRVSTEDNQVPDASRAWQLRRANALIVPKGGRIVAEFFDVDKSRSIPWARRPQATELINQLKNPARDFEAVVIGEPHRAFYGNRPADPNPAIPRGVTP